MAASIFNLCHDKIWRRWGSAEDRIKPSYVTTDFVLPESTPKHKDLEFEIVKSDFLTQRALVATYNSDIVRLFGDMQMHMFEPSIAQIQSLFDDYAEVTTARCPLLLWKLVIKSHTFAGREASFVEKEKVKSTLQKLRQSSLTLSEHNSRFDAQLKICKDMQIDIDIKWVIYTLFAHSECVNLWSTLTLSLNRSVGFHTIQ